MTHDALRRLALIAAVASPAVFAAPRARAQPADVAKTNPLKVYMHYMPWFETPQTLGAGNWGYHWKLRNQDPNIVADSGRRQIASHFYPLIGPYASSDKDVIEYHLLLMKLSGVDGVLIDWYGVEGSNGDIDLLLANSNALVDRVDDVGLDFGVALEDRFSANIGQAQANVAYLRDNYFNKPEYIRAGDDDSPLLAVFGPITFQQESDWTQILSEAGGPVDLLTLWYESGDVGDNGAGEYAWVYEDEATDDHLARQRNFYQNRTRDLDVAGGVAYPGFEDFYEEGGVGNVVPFEIPHQDGATLDELLDLAGDYANRIDFLQLATFNDFGEGTIFEPSVETGFEYLKKVQQFTGTPYGEDELRLVYRLYLARKEYDDAATQATLDQVSGLLAGLDISGATTLLDSVAPAGDYDGDGDVDAADYGVWRASFGVRTVLAGSGADGNYDGVVNAADFTVWRDGMHSGAAAAPPLPVPEPGGAWLTLGLAALVGGAAPALGAHADSRARRACMR